LQGLAVRIGRRLIVQYLGKEFRCRGNVVKNVPVDNQITSKTDIVGRPVATGILAPEPIEETRQTETGNQFRPGGEHTGGVEVERVGRGSRVIEMLIAGLKVQSAVKPFPEPGFEQAAIRCNRGASGTKSPVILLETAGITPVGIGDPVDLRKQAGGPGIGDSGPGRALADHEGGFSLGRHLVGSEANAMFTGNTGHTAFYVLACRPVLRVVDCGENVAADPRRLDEMGIAGKDIVVELLADKGVIVECAVAGEQLA